MSKKLYDAAVKVGSYEKNGETKNKYKNVGVVIKSDKGPYLLLDRTFNPAGVPNPDGKDSVLISLFEPREDKPAQETGGGGATAHSPENDEIPFAHQYGEI
jgi:hypothetical protein